METGKLLDREDRESRSWATPPDTSRQLGQVASPHLGPCWHQPVPHHPAPLTQEEDLGGGLSEGEGKATDMSLSEQSPGKRRREGGEGTDSLSGVRTLRIE